MTAFTRPLAHLSALALALAALALLAGCENKMEPKECDKLRGEAFEILNKAHHCNADADCRQSEWPGCAKPLSNADHDKIKPLADKFQGGKCEEPKVDCKAPPEVYCKQGLCVHREKGTPEDEGRVPSDQIKIE
ncbi:hypothetical protein [Chondromyces apiculatus]|uniref:Lipoprotein n=1 Tax=Chondromyces apiculatus DSM 436 TaxID=1192034 RepID=A0A017TDL6_9BACT|nr:hypothetical protein [Chondromyces apiculatus]EYF07002.1 Hypothetical protein CAP_1261 [Chondromyces apiculatus DSM 436]